ncbi:sensor domain-containing protein [Micromonospora sp. NPDC050276]|uniref:sensor domain-containing protein n=1 Tax=Micromonospora sp. NPDC050276 TaxID=3364278 RepID=UPI003798C2B2
MLATLWITSISIAALGAGIPLTLLATVLVRWFADLHRQWAADRLGEPVPARPYQPTPDAGWPVRLWTILRDPATWRDWIWLVVNSITIWLSCGLSLLFFIFGVVYLTYPLIYQLTPSQVFRTPMGEGFRLHSVAQSFGLVPLGPVFLLLWYVTAVRLANLNARVIRALLGPPNRRACGPASNSWRPRELRPSTPRPVNCAESNATCTTARRPGWCRWV